MADVWDDTVSTVVIVSLKHMPSNVVTSMHERVKLAEGTSASRSQGSL